MDQEAIHEQIDKIIDEFCLRFPFIGEGRNRKVFDLENGFVVKVPTSFEGCIDNCNEAYYYSKNSTEPYCKCWIDDDSEYIPLLIMEKVEPVKSTKGLPEWVDFIDCQQVGHNCNGDLLAYDYA